MRQFRFTLQAVLTLRQQQEQEAMTRYARSLLARELAVERLAIVEHELAVARRDWVERAARGFSGPQAVHFQHYDLALNERRKKLAEAVTDAERAINQALQAMLFARQEREAVEIFQQRQKTAHDRALSRDEQKALDDLAGRLRSSALAWSANERVSV